MEVDLNESNKVIDIIKRRMASDAQDMAADVASAFHTVQAGNAFLSLIDAVDDTSLGAATYGGLARATYGISGNYTATVGNLTLATMDTTFNNCTHGPNMPTLLLCTKSVWAYFHKLAIPTTSMQAASTALTGYPQFVGATANGVPNIVAPGTKLSAGLGFNSLYFRGTPLIADENAPTGYCYFLNTRKIAFYGLKSTKEGYKTVQFNEPSLDSVYSVPSVTGFAFSGFNTPVDQYGSVGHFVLMGNLICEDPRCQGLLGGITGA
jgi:hypothetical protein